MKYKTLAVQVGIAATSLALWEGVGRSSKETFFLIGTPLAVWTELIKLLLSEQLVFHFWATSTEAVLGLLIGTVIGSLAGLGLWYSEDVATITRPFIIGLGTLPVFAFAPLMIVWFGVGFKMKVAMVAFCTVFVAFTQAYKGATSVGTDLLDSLRSMNASKYQIFCKVVIPGSLDWVLSSMRLNVGFGLLGALIGEFIASDRGLGYLILRASGLYNIPRALAAAVGITALAILLDAVARYIEKHSHHLVQWLSVPRVLWQISR